MWALPLAASLLVPLIALAEALAKCRVSVTQDLRRALERVEAADLHARWQTAAVRAEAPSLSKDAAAVAEIIGEWRRTADDKSFAMRTRFFPSGVKIPGVKWTD